MKFIGFINFYLFLLLLAFSKAQPRSYGGKYAVDGQFPYMALLFYNDRDRGSCGASIFHERWALTAGHCVKYDRNKPTLTVGTLKNSKSAGTTYEVEKFYVHPDFIGIPEDENNGLEYVANDIGLIRLMSNITFNDKVQPVGLPTDEENFYENSTANLSGWGSAKFYEGIHKSLYYVNVRVLGLEECKRVWTYADKHICTSNHEHQGMCYGDSGSPLVVDGVQIGVASTGDTYCQSLKPDLYTKVASFVSWIKNITSHHGDTLPDLQNHRTEH